MSKQYPNNVVEILAAGSGQAIPGARTDSPYRIRPHLRPSSKDVATRDSFQNFAAKVGIGTDNQHSASQYGFNPISRNRLLLEWCYRGSWLAGVIVDAPAEDMTREWIEIICSADHDQLADFETYLQELQMAAQLTSTAKWGNLYGGATGLILIEGQDNSTPLRPETIGMGQFKGIYPLDRWMTVPRLEELVTDFGPYLGKPEYYDLLPNVGTGLEMQSIHYTRLVRMEGLELPWWQKITENYWGQSVLERLWDRMVSFDSASMGAAQLTYKAHLRTFKVKGLRELIAAGGDMIEALYEQINLMRRFATSEGLTIIDGEDEVETTEYTFSGLADIINCFGEQLSGASQIPLVRLFGQSPAGLSATGESDMRNYYDGIKMKQERILRPPLNVLLPIAWRSKFGTDMPKGWKFKFKPLYQMNDQEKAEVTSVVTHSITEAVGAGIIDHATGAKELKQLSSVTGAYSNITDDSIKDLESLPPITAEAAGLALPPKPIPGGAGGKPEGKGSANSPG